MGQVDDFQLGEEAVAQMQEEQEEREREALHASLREEPLAATAELTRRVELIPIDDISTGFNIRRKLTNIEELARGIRQRGQQVALEVREAGDDEQGPYVLIAGARRLAALRLIQDATGEPVLARCEVVEGVDEADHFALQFIENDREELPPEDVARGVRLLINKHPDWDAQTLAASFGKSVEWARGHLRRLELPAEIVARIESGDLSFTAADLLRKATKSGKLSDAEAVQRADAIADGELTTGDLRAEVAPAKPKSAGVDFDAPDNSHLDDWGDGDAPRTDHAANWTPPEPEYDSRGVDPALESAADALLSASPGRSDDKALPWDNEPLAEPAAGGRTPAWTLLDAYLLGRVLQELASDELLDGMDVTREGVFKFADQLGAGDRASTLRKVAQKLLREDPSAPIQYADAADADI